MIEELNAEAFNRAAREADRLELVRIVEVPWMVGPDGKPWPSMGRPLFMVSPAGGRDESFLRGRLAVKPCGAFWGKYLDELAPVMLFRRPRGGVTEWVEGRDYLRIMHPHDESPEPCGLAIVRCLTTDGPNGPTFCDVQHLNAEGGLDTNHPGSWGEPTPARADGDSDYWPVEAYLHDERTLPPAMAALCR
jgi:hypothetical protein